MPPPESPIPLPLTLALALTLTLTLTRYTSFESWLIAEADACGAGRSVLSRLFSVATVSIAIVSMAIVSIA